MFHEVWKLERFQTAKVTVKVIRRPALATINPHTKFGSLFTFTHYENMKDDTIYQKWGGLG